MTPERAALLERAQSACQTAWELHDRALTAPVPTGRLRVHLGFRDGVTREQVLELLEELGEWPDVRVQAEPGEGVYAALPGESGHLALLVMRERLDRALTGLDPDGHVSMHVAREIRTG